MRSLGWRAARVMAPGAAALLLGAGAAHAKMLATGLLLSSNADLLDCFVSNVGTETITITTARIHGYQGNVLAADDGCSGANLQAGKSCTVSASVQAGRFRLVYTGADRAVRAQCQLTTDQNNILATTEAR